MPRITTKARRTAVFLISSLPIYACLWAQSPDPRMRALKGEMKVLEAVIDQSLSESFPPPFGVLEKAKGTYLPDFGVAFSVEVYLYPMRTPTPFDTRPTTPAEEEKARRAQLARIAAIKKSVPHMLVEYASGLRDVRPEESVAIIIHFFHAQAESEKVPSQIVMVVRKQSLDDLWDKKISFDELLEKVKWVEL
jgi:hypothetical protein